MGQPNFLLIVCDSLRADYLSTYGGSVDAGVFDSIASEGTVFERAYAAGPGSPISHAALFAGQYPSSSGVGAQRTLPADIPLMAAHLKDHGYETFGMPGPSRIGSHWGYNRGFNEYLEKWSDIPSSLSFTDLRAAIEDPELVAPMPTEFLRRARRGSDKYTSYLLDVFDRKVRGLDSPYFAFVNITTVHTPYDPPRPYKQEATPSLVRPRTGLGDMLGGTEYFKNNDLRFDRITAAQIHEGVPRYYADSSYLTDAELEVLKSWYSASIRYLDYQLSAVLDELRAAGELENTVIILTADHGEGLGDHGLLKHMFSHFESVLGVPLVMTGPGVPVCRRSDLVSLIDVFPTMCDLAGIPPSPRLDGRSLFDHDSEERSGVFAENGSRELSEVYRKYLSRHEYERIAGALKSVRTSEHLFTIDSTGEERLYELPCEVKIPHDEGPVNKMRAMIENELGSGFAPGSGTQENMGNKINSNLRRLGYIQ